MFSDTTRCAASSLLQTLLQKEASGEDFDGRGKSPWGERVSQFSDLVEKDPSTVRDVILDKLRDPDPSDYWSNFATLMGKSGYNEPELVTAAQSLLESPKTYGQLEICAFIMVSGGHSFSRNEISFCEKYTMRNKTPLLWIDVLASSLPENIIRLNDDLCEMVKNQEVMFSHATFKLNFISSVYPDLKEALSPIFDKINAINDELKGINHGNRAVTTSKSQNNLNTLNGEDLGNSKQVKIIIFKFSIASQRVVAFEDRKHSSLGRHL